MGSPSPHGLSIDVHIPELVEPTDCTDEETRSGNKSTVTSMYVSIAKDLRQKNEKDPSAIHEGRNTSNEYRAR